MWTPHPPGGPQDSGPRDPAPCWEDLVSHLQLRVAGIETLPLTGGPLSHPQLKLAFMETPVHAWRAYGPTPSMGQLVLQPHLLPTKLRSHLWFGHLVWQTGPPSKRTWCPAPVSDQPLWRFHTTPGGLGSSSGQLVRQNCPLPVGLRVPHGPELLPC